MVFHRTVKEAEYKPEFGLTNDTPYLALVGELWDIYCEKIDHVITARHCISKTFL